VSVTVKSIGWALAALAGAAVEVSLRVKNEVRLARRLADRDPQVMGDLYERYGRLAYSLILRIVRNAAAAEDLVQETFLRIWNRAQASDPERSALGPWIVTVARNRAIDYLRAANGRRTVEAVDLDRLERPVLFAGFEEGALSVERARHLKEAFEKLSPNQKRVLELAYYEGLSPAEMAERLSQPLGDVNAWLRAGLTALREESTREAATA
jgi:RNA polymerase sigma-70 factor (ECF subfamily)